MQVAGDPFGPGNLALGLPKGSPYKAALDRAMITLRSNGFIDVLRRQWLPADYCSNAASAVRLSGWFDVWSHVVGVWDPGPWWLHKVACWTGCRV